MGGTIFPHIKRLGDKFRDLKPLKAENEAGVGKTRMGFCVIILRRQNNGHLGFKLAGLIILYGVEMGERDGDERHPWMYGHVPNKHDDADDYHYHSYDGADYGCGPNEGVGGFARIM
jgi:hypothetical protein